MKRVTASFFTLPAVAMLLLSGCGNAVKEYEAVNTAMGTVVTQKLYTEGDDVTGDVEQLLSGMEETMLSRRIVFRGRKAECQCRNRHLHGGFRRAGRDAAGAFRYL